jgi:DNA invertase Pin-like site-specific DNA recombinase
MGKRYGYARVSSKGQELKGNSLEDQENKLWEAGCDVVEKEAFTGTTMDRPKFTELLEKLEQGDTLVVCKLDRFARSAGEGSKLVKDLIIQGINVHILNMGLIEDTPTGRLIMNVLLSFAEFERDMIVERTSAGKAIARENNPDYKEGRKKMEIHPEFDSYRKKVSDGDLSVVDACKRMNISRSTWYKWVREKEVA